MADVAQRGRATVLPEVHRMSVAHDPLLERTGHPTSGKAVRRDRKRREKILGKQRGVPWPALALLGAAQPEATVMLERREVLVWLSGKAKAR